MTNQKHQQLTKSQELKWIILKSYIHVNQRQLNEVEEYAPLEVITLNATDKTQKLLSM